MDARTLPCSRCVELEGQLRELAARVAFLEAELAAARKNSSNSSKPPSSDIVKPPKPTPPGGRKRQRGGQPGHARHERASFPADEVDVVHEYTLSSCPDCGGTVQPRHSAP